jgi:lysophospholipase L1-like esterase
MKDRQLFWKLRPNVDMVFLHHRICTNRYGFRSDDPVPGRRVVLCLGDSVSFGWEVAQPQAFPQVLQTRLNSAAKSGKLWSVINAAVPNYSSFQVVRQAETLIPRWKPEVVIVCVGGADTCPVEQSDREMDADRAVSLWGAVGMKDRSLAFHQLANAVPRVSQDDYVANLRQVARIARQAGAKLILLNPPVNLMWRPKTSDGFPEWKKWDAILQSVIDLVNQGAVEKAAKKAEAALGENPDPFDAYWLQAVISLARGDLDHARTLFEQSLESHPFPGGLCKRSIRDAAAKLAREEKVSLLDVTDLFFSRDMDLFQDSAHFSPQGHAVIADLLFETITGHKPHGSTPAEGRKNVATDGAGSVPQHAQQANRQPSP